MLEICHVYRFYPTWSSTFSLFHEVVNASFWSFSPVFATTVFWSMWHLRMNDHEMERTGKVVKSLQEGVILARQRQGLGALPPLLPSLCPSLTRSLSDIAVILSCPFICLPNGNPPSVWSSHSGFFPASLSHFSFFLLPCDTHRDFSCLVNWVMQP